MGGTAGGGSHGDRPYPGGSGSRFHGSFIPKQFAEIEEAILAYCLDTYEALPAVNEVVLIIGSRYEQLYYDICSTYGYLEECAS